MMRFGKHVCIRRMSMPWFEAMGLVLLILATGSL